MSDDDLKMRLAANLRRLRIAHHLSQSELARVTSMSKATLSGIEKGGGNPTVDTLASLAGALRTTVADLLKEAQLGEVRILRASLADRAPTYTHGRRQLEERVKQSNEMDLYELSLPPGHVHEQSARSAGSREGALVLQGMLIAGPVDRISELTVGDYISFPADVPYVYEARSTAVRVLVIAYTLG